MSDTDGTPQIQDVPDQHRFVYVDDQAGAEAELVYRHEPGRLVLVHTGVPDSLGGRGLGGRLVRAAVAKAAADGLTVVPHCPFARKWLQEHDDVAATVDIDWTPPKP